MNATSLLSDPHPTLDVDASTPPSELRVLCVDDNVDGVDSLCEMLGLVGCETASAYNAEEALVRVEAFRPQACILDINMPGMDGCGLARRLRERAGSEAMLLIALTALGDHASLERMADSGFDLYYPKPVAPSLLYQVLSDFIRQGRPA